MAVPNLLTPISALPAPCSPLPPPPKNSGRFGTSISEVKQGEVVGIIGMQRRRANPPCSRSSAGLQSLPRAESI